jgi:hypothetical protein
MKFILARKKWKGMLTVRFRAFRAIDDPLSCEKFIEGHRKVLEIYDIAMITSNKAVWTTHKNTYVIIAEEEEGGRALGGARIQIADDILPLPIEDAVGKVDKNIYNIVAKYKEEKTGELCGLWNSREIAGYGVGSMFLTRAAIALAAIRGMRSLFALAAPATVKMACRAGFDIERTLGKNGFFNYPKINLVATALKINNVRTLESAREFDRERIFDLIQTPTQKRQEAGPKGTIQINYQLAITSEPNEQ